jgi:predicted Zn-ribbon and HTH transcriptional regulator
MNPAQKCREEKELHPERFCPVRGCLWRVRHRDGRETPCQKHRTVVPARCDKPATRYAENGYRVCEACLKLESPGEVFTVAENIGRCDRPVDVLGAMRYTAPENCRDCGTPFNNANPGPNGRCEECNA